MFSYMSTHWKTENFVTTAISYQVVREDLLFSIKYCLDLHYQVSKGQSSLLNITCEKSQFLKEYKDSKEHGMFSTSK